MKIYRKCSDGFKTIDLYYYEPFSNKYKHIGVGIGQDYVGLFWDSIIRLVVPKNPFRGSVRRLLSIRAFKLKFELYKWNMSDMFPIIKRFPSERYPSTIPGSTVRGLAVLTFKFTIF